MPSATPFIFNFPPEIEDEIFELAVSSDRFHRAGARLSRVSKRVQARIEPILYRTLMLDGNLLEPNSHRIEGLVREDRFWRALKSKPASFFRKNVMNLYIRADTISDKFLQKLLSVCSGVEHIALFNYSLCIDKAKVWNFITAMPLRSLECSPGIYEALLQNKTVFPYLTFLKVDEVIDSDTIINKGVFKYLVSLTHLAVTVRSGRRHVHHDTVQTMLKTAISNARFLKSLIVHVKYSPMEYYALGMDIHHELDSWEKLDKRVWLDQYRYAPIRHWKNRIEEDPKYFVGGKGHWKDKDDMIRRPWPFWYDMMFRFS